MDSTYLNASDGTGEAVRAVVAADRDIGNVEINVDSTDNWPSKWVATSGTVLASGVFDPDTICVFYGYTSGSFLYIDGFAPGYSDVGHTANQIIVIKPTTLWADTLVDSIGGGGGGSGTVTSVAQTVPTGFTVTGSPVTTTGTLAMAYDTGYQGYTAAEATKLSGIEAGADVTDTANVTAAGALMDSEVTNLAQVKAFNSADYATAAEGVLAVSAVQPGDLATVATTGAYSDLSGTPTIPTSVDNLGPSQTGNSGKFLTTDGTNASWATLGGGGDMTAAVYDPAGIGQQVVGTTATQTLTNKTLTSPVLNTSISGTAFLDEDDMASNSATKVASQQSIKAYVDAAISSATATAWLAALPVNAVWNGGDNSANPSTYLPGHSGSTWVAHSEDRFVVGHGSTYTSTGGSATHNHDLSNNGGVPFGLNSSATYVNRNGPSVSLTAGNAQSGMRWGGSSATITTSLGLRGTTDTTDNVPPYQAAYIWRRTA